MTPTAETVNEAVRIIVDTVHPLKVILFGSAARGEMAGDSDLDFLIVVPKGTHRRRAAQAIYRNIIGISLPVDIVVATEEDLATYGDNPSLVFKRALQDGRTVYAA
jgi:predicted nucleotidyltransferase